MAEISFKEIVVCPDCGLKQEWFGRVKLSRHSTLICKDCKKKMKVKPNIKRL